MEMAENMAMLRERQATGFGLNRGGATCGGPETHHRLSRQKTSYPSVV